MPEWLYVALFFAWMTIGVIVIARCEAKRLGVSVRDLGKLDDDSVTSSRMTVFIPLWPLALWFYWSLEKTCERIDKARAEDAARMAANNKDQT